MIDRAAGHDFEVLGLLAPSRGAVGQRAGETCSGDGYLGHSVNNQRGFDTHDLVDGRARRRCSAGSDPSVPGRAQPSSASGSPTGCGSHPNARRAVSHPCTGVLPAQPHPVVVLGCRSSVNPSASSPPSCSSASMCMRYGGRYGVLGQQFCDGAVLAFSRGSVVAPDVEEQGVVAVAEPIELIDDAGRPGRRRCSAKPAATSIRRRWNGFSSSGMFFPRRHPSDHAR